MSNERYQEIIDEAYKNYLKGGDIKWLKQEEVDTPNGNMKMNILIPYTKEEFINKIITDPEFSKRCGLIIYTKVECDDVWMGIVYNNNAVQIKIEK